MSFFTFFHIFHPTTKFFFTRSNGFLKRLTYLKSNNVQKWEIRFTLGLNTAKITHYMKKASNKSCSELNFIQKSPGLHMSISPTSGAIGLQRVSLKSYYAQKRDIRFTLGLNTEKIRVIWKKGSNKSCSELNFVWKSSRALSKMANLWCLIARGGR